MALSVTQNSPIWKVSSINSSYESLFPTGFPTDAIHVICEYWVGISGEGSLLAKQFSFNTWKTVFLRQQGEDILLLKILGCSRSLLIINMNHELREFSTPLNFKNECKPHLITRNGNRIYTLKCDSSQTRLEMWSLNTDSNSLQLTSRALLQSYDYEIESCSINDYTFLDYDSVNRWVIIATKNGACEFLPVADSDKGAVFLSTTTAITSAAVMPKGQCALVTRRGVELWNLFHDHSRDINKGTFISLINDLTSVPLSLFCDKVFICHLNTFLRLPRETITSAWVVEGRLMTLEQGSLKMRLLPSASNVTSVFSLTPNFVVNRVVVGSTRFVAIGEEGSFQFFFSPLTFLDG